jgi:hypothetical protein
MTGLRLAFRTVVEQRLRTLRHTHELNRATGASRRTTLRRLVPVDDDHRHRSSSAVMNTTVQRTKWFNRRTY